MTCLLNCCDNEEFEIKYSGVLNKNVFNHFSILPNDTDDLVIIATCKKCKNEYSIFNNKEDGYDNFYEKKNKENIELNFKSFDCKKCKCNDYIVNIRLEYSDDVLTGKVNEKFTWIYIDLVCKSCQKNIKILLAQKRLKIV